MLLKRPDVILAYLKGTNEKAANEAYYDDQAR